jgi:hypothetical protein
MAEFLRDMDSIGKLDNLSIKIFYPIKTRIAGKEVQAEYLKEACKKLSEFIGSHSETMYLRKYYDALSNKYEELR